MKKAVITIRVLFHERQLLQALLRAEGSTMQEYLTAVIKEKNSEAPDALKELVQYDEAAHA